MSFGDMIIQSKVQFKVTVSKEDGASLPGSCEGIYQDADSCVERRDTQARCLNCRFGCYCDERCVMISYEKVRW
jgi:hypothetical protein